MRPKTAPVLVECIETGLDLGWARAFKHDDNPSPDAIKHRLADAIWSEICERFYLDEEADK